MKKIIASALILLLAFGGKAGAQIIEEKPNLSSNELSLSYGRISLPAFAMTFGAVMGIVFTAGVASPDEIGSTGAFGLEYNHYFRDGRTSVGVLTTVEDFRISWKTATGDKDENGNTIYKSTGEFTHNVFIALMPTIKYRWVSKEHFGMYSKLAGGGCMVTSTEKPEFSWALQVNPIAMEAGNQKVRGFLELGLGFQGLVMGGIRVTL